MLSAERAILADLELLGLLLLVPGVAVVAPFAFPAAQSDDFTHVLSPRSSILDL